MESNQISDAEMPHHTFSGRRPASSGKHCKWDKLFLTAKSLNSKLS